MIKAFHALDWGTNPHAYRINALDTPFFYRDIIDIGEQCGDALDGIIIPKVSRPEDLYVVDTLLTQIEAAMGLSEEKIKLEEQIENALGLVNIDRIALSTGRLEALVFGYGDYAASVRMPAASIGAMDWWDEHYRTSFPADHRFLSGVSRYPRAARGLPDYVQCYDQHRSTWHAKGHTQSAKLRLPRTQ